MWAIQLISNQTYLKGPFGDILVFEYFNEAVQEKYDSIREENLSFWTVVPYDKNEVQK